MEGERNVLADNESKLEEKVRQLTSQLEVERLAAANAIEQLEQEQCDKRELQEELNDIKVIMACIHTCRSRPCDFNFFHQYSNKGLMDYKCPYGYTAMYIWLTN